MVGIIDLRETDALLTVTVLTGGQPFITGCHTD